MNNKRVPKGTENCVQYINNGVAYLQKSDVEGGPTNAERLGIQNEVSEWTEIASKLSEPYALWKDPIEGRTRAVSAKVQSCLKTFNDYILNRKVLDQIAASPNVNETDLEVFNIKLRSRKITKEPLSKITAFVDPSFTNVGSGFIKVRCRNNVDSGIHIIKEANCVEYRYLIGEEPPTSPDDVGLILGLSTKATFILELPAKEVQKKLFIYMRWNNQKHRDIAGPWTRLSTINL